MKDCGLKTSSDIKFDFTFPFSWTKFRHFVMSVYIVHLSIRDLR